MFEPVHVAFQELLTVNSLIMIVYLSCPSYLSQFSMPFSLGLSRSGRVEIPQRRVKARALVPGLFPSTWRNLSAFKIALQIAHFRPRAGSPIGPPMENEGLTLVE
jgi:hypothetical protein